MRCGKGHPRLFALPLDAVVEWSAIAAWIHAGPIISSELSRDQALLRCGEPDCHRAMRAFVVNGRHSDKVTCGPRCLAAIGPDCECSCSGANHGAN